MEPDAWLTLAVTIGVLALLIRGGISPAVVMMAGVLALFVTGVISTGQALGGFANPAPITVGALYVLAGAIDKTGALSLIMRRAMGDRGSLRLSLLRTLIPTSAASAFLNNTPIVALLIPQATTWAARRGISVSQLLMPISFAAVLGGTVTLIGSSTNLVVAGQMQVRGLDPIGFFEIGAVGLPLTIVGMVLIVLLGPRMLPNKKSLRVELEESGRHLSVEMVVVPGGPIDGQTILGAGLRGRKGVFLATVDRGHTMVAPARPETMLLGGDRLYFVGDASQVMDLHLTQGLRFAERDHIFDMSNPAVSHYEAVIGSESPLVGETLVSSSFRSNYQAAVLAVHREGRLLTGKLGTIRLQVGDTLILIADPGFRDRWGDRADFLLVAAMSGRPRQATKQAWIAIATLLAVVFLAATGTVPIVQGALVGAVAMVGFNVITPLEARRSVDMEVLVVIAAAFGIAAAMETTGLAQEVANLLTQAFAWAGPRGILLGIVLATMILTEVITNNAAALLMLPIALGAAATAGLDPRGVAIAVAVMASASFLTPIGYQTNTMVLGPGGYRFSDYVKFGFPLSITAVIMVVTLVPAIWSGS